MLNYIWPILIIFSFIYSIFNGNVDKLNNSIFESFDEVIKLNIILITTTFL